MGKILKFEPTAKMKKLEKRAQHNELILIKYNLLPSKRIVLRKKKGSFLVSNLFRKE